MPTAQFVHAVSGRYYRSNDATGALKGKSDFDSLTEYKDVCRAAYGDLRGVKFYTFGKDYDALDAQSRPMKNGRHLH